VICKPKNTCAAASFDATLTNGTALSGGGPGTDFTIIVPFGPGVPITIHNLQIQGTVTNNGTRSGFLVGGGIVGVVPGKFGIGIFSPPLDSKGNSVRGIRVCEELSQRFGLHIFDCHAPQGGLAEAIKPHGAGGSKA
jgi:glutaminase